MNYYIYKSTYICVFTFLVQVYAQKQLNDTCIVENGKPGQCLLFRDCADAIEMVRSRSRIPEHCGFVGKHPIVCCERQTKILKARPVGEISKQKCKEVYGAFPTITQSSPSRHARTVIIEGVDAKPAEFPHMAILGYETENEKTWGCTGILISDKFVLSAAHCMFSNSLGRPTHVRVGDLDLKTTTESSKPQDRNVTRILVHPKYRPPSVYHDIALIELASKVDINDFVRPACLYTESDDPEGEWVGIGWGLTSFSGDAPRHQQKVHFRSYTLTDCEKAYALTTKRRISAGINMDTQICAGEFVKDTCQGDSGGPLQIKNPEFSQGYTVIGVTSFGKVCGIGNVPSVFTRVSHYIEWIESVVWPQ